jgi:glycosyltransferase involved in cell wall biosynthesis
VRRALIALHEGVAGGATLSVLRCVPILEERGWELAFWAPRPSEVFDRLAAEGRDVVGASPQPAYSRAALRLEPGAVARLRTAPSYFRRFAAAARRARPDLVHANSLTTIGELVAARAVGRRALFHLHEMAPPGRKGALAARVARRAANRVVAVSEACARSWAVDGWSPGVVPEGCPIPAEPPPLPGGRRLVVGTVGVIAPRKGIDVFLDAAEEAMRRGLEVDFELVGAPTEPLEADWARRTIDRARALGVRHRLRADVGAALAGWDAFVLASRRDPFPISLLEAMASARPVIAEQVAPGTGILVAPEDPAALAAAIASIAALPPERRREIGAAARRRARRFSIERQTEALEAAYLETIG